MTHDMPATLPVNSSPGATRMRRRIRLAGAMCLVLVAGYTLGHLLRGPESAPPRGFTSRVVDAIPRKDIVEFSGEVDGIDVRLRYMRDDRGLRPLDLADLSWYIAEKHGTDPAAREEAIRDLIRLHNPRDTIVLSSMQDIPGFQREQLDPDLRDLSLACWDAPDPDNPAMTITIVCTWTRIGGVLKRYRFRTHRDHAPYCYSSVALQGGLGAAAYLI